ncbi:MAG: DNA/RNA nuclease SfsA [Planctomycetota bacterium]
MRFDPPLVHGTLIRRYKRFLADIELDSGEVITAHVANPGSMLDVAVPQQPVALSKHENKKRKLPWSWELIDLGQSWVCVNTSLPNHLVEEAILDEGIPELAQYPELTQEVAYGEASRIDILLDGDERGRCYVEIKNVTLARGQLAVFPDSVTARGQKHLRELMAMRAEGHRAVMFFLVSREDCLSFSPADDIDPRYGELLRESSARGVEILAYRCQVNPHFLRVDRSIPVVL